MSTATRQAVFLDRDGTIVEDADFLTDLAELRILPGAVEGIRKLNEAGFLVLVLTNQSGVARGFLTEGKLREIHEKLSSMLQAQGARIDGYYYCPHHPTIGSPRYRIDCACRKPKPGMFLQAAKEHGLVLDHSFAIGDSLRDGQAAQAAGVRSLLVRTGPNLEEAVSQPELYWRQADDLLAAAEIIVPTSSASPS